MKIVITVKDTDNVIGLKEDIAMRLEGVTDIVRIDTADVVPKSEVEELLTRLNNVYVAIDIAEGDVYRLEKENEELKDTNQHLFEFIAEVKREIARDIFEEIDKILLFGTEHICSSDYSFYRDYAELKKKYTEEQT